ncbi:MAG: GntR family transcriptional regulator [Planctomycetota bacterium]|jgi:DNA-binding LacI/PurR family transcriptional regulator/DNA-binding transcriptional regulator YhcF (GntR family)
MAAKNIISKNIPVYEQVYEVLRKRIETGEYPLDSKIPTVTELKHEMSIAHMTSYKAIRRLADEGYVVSSTGKDGRKGTFVISRTPAKKPFQQNRIATLFYSLEDTKPQEDYWFRMLCRIQVSLGSELILSSNYTHKSEESVEQYKRDLDSELFSGIIACQNTPEAMVELALEKGLPVVGVSREGIDNKIYTISPDFEAAGRKTAEMQAKMGYERFIFYRKPQINNDDKWETNFYFVNRTFLKGYESKIKELTGKDVLVLRDCPFEEHEQQIQSFIDDRSAAMASVSTKLAREIYEKMIENNDSRYEDLGIVTIADFHSSPAPIPSWYINTDLLADSAVEILLNLLGGNKRIKKNQLTDLEWVERPE